MPGTITRRQVLTTTGALLGAGLLAPRLGAAAEGVDLTGWFAKTDGADAVEDRRGEARVEIGVGTQGNGGAFAFSPVAVRIDPGTEVVWTWTGEGGSHNVVAENGAFASEYHSEKGATFSYVAETAGVTRYACAPHKPMGMRGALVVGDVAVTMGASATPTPVPETETPAGDESDDPEKPAFGGWLAETDNYHRVVDLRGESEVFVKVGADGNGGQFAFEPAAIHVDPGTTVVWEWVGTAGAYDVVDPNLGIASERTQGEGHRFALRFDGDGLSTYGCTEYGEQGMRGVVLVGAGPQEEVTWTGAGVGLGVTAVLAAPLAYGLRLHGRTATKREE
jgi:halocyanin-like protein